MFLARFAVLSSPRLTLTINRYASRPFLFSWLASNLNQKPFGKLPKRNKKITNVLDFFHRQSQYISRYIPGEGQNSFQVFSSKIRKKQTWGQKLCGLLTLQNRCLSSTPSTTIRADYSTLPFSREVPGTSSTGTTYTFCERENKTRLTANTYVQYSCRY